MDTLKQESVPYKSKRIITEAKSQSNTKDQFLNKLKENNIDILLRINDEGKLYSVTFIDHANKIAFNGSRIGKRFSANSMDDWFSGLGNSHKSVNPRETGIADKNILLIDVSPNTGFINDHYPQHLSPNGGRITAGTPDPEEEEFIRRMKRKKKKG